MMQKLSIDLEDLQMAFKFTSSEVEQYLDRQTGQVVLNSEDFPLEAELDNMDRYLPIPTADSRAAYDDMEWFVMQVEDSDLREALANAINGRKPFRRFKDTLLGRPEREQWFKFSNERMQQRIVEWLADEGIEPLAQEN
ncbi:MAG: UPF0158 family protein [Cyanobacteria bacterium P01_G01_bin.54]